MTVTGVIQFLGYVLIGLGAMLIVLASVGLWRFPDALVRALAVTRVTGLGLVAILAGTALVLNRPAVWARTMVAVAMVVATMALTRRTIRRVASQ